MAKYFGAANPQWPWVQLGLCVSDPRRNVPMPASSNDGELMDQIMQGRLRQSLVEANIKETRSILVESFGFEHSAQNKSFTGQQNDEPAMLTRYWSIDNTSGDLDNTGFVHLDAQGRTLSEDGGVVDRRFDHLLSVLESLPVGSKDGQPADKLWEKSRTVNSAVYPKGPNVRIRFQQDKPYRADTINQAGTLPVMNSNCSLLSTCH